MDRYKLGRRSADGGVRRFVVTGRRALTVLAALALTLPVALPVAAAEPDRRLDRPLRAERLDGLRLPQPLSGAAVVTAASRIDPSLLGATGRRTVVVRLRGASAGRQADRSSSAVMSRKAQLEVDQGEFLNRRGALAGLKVLARTQLVLNAVVVEVDAERIPALAQDPMVERITPVGNYVKHLTETVPHIGAHRVHAKGVKGDGIRVAVLDSGIDYTHAALGGRGTVAAYQRAYEDPADPRGFPTARVVGGFDFVGEDWNGDPDGPELAPDPDPIDADGHGTHVADIIGGVDGVAPKVDLYAVKVCSAVSPACSGVALLAGLEFAVDPNGDGDPEDAVDIINMSLGADYGQPFDDEISQAVEAATLLGVLTVASAGNGGDRPYVLGTPSAAPSALSVAQTQVPSATQPQIEVDGTLHPAVFQPWSEPPGGVISGPLQYGDGAGGNLLGCEPFEAGALAGKVVLVDRGACNFTTKIVNIGNAGGIVGIIGLVTPEPPFAGGAGDDVDQVSIPGYMISQADADAMRSAIAAGGATATVDPANDLPLVGQLASTSSRGPQHEDTTLIKPEIAAPGGSVSAEVGTGDGSSPFGGTSGAAPMVTGSAALLLEKFPALRPPEVKARLVNVAETDIDTDPTSGLAPITRIGGGEVRVNRSVRTRVAAWDHETLTPALSFGFKDVDRKVDVQRKLVRVRNYSNRNLWLEVNASFRYDDDAENGAVRLRTMPRLFVRKRSEAWLPVWLRVRGDALRSNAMNSGSEGGNPAALTLNEYDGYLHLEGSGVSLHLPWHVLPRQASNVVARKVLRFRDGTDRVSLVNKGIGTAQVDAYSLLAVSPDVPEGGPGRNSPTPDLRAVGINTFPVPAGICSQDTPSFVWAFAVNTWERQQHLLPVSHLVFLDIDRDGEDDYVVLNRDASGLGTISDGRQVTYAVDLATDAPPTASFFAEHATNTGNTVLLVCAEQVGLSGDDLLSTRVNMTVVAQDFYNAGPGDQIVGLTVTPGAERFVARPEDVPGRSVRPMPVTDFGAFRGNSDELGVLLFTNGDRGPGARGGAVAASEALLLYHPSALRGEGLPGL